MKHKLLALFKDSNEITDDLKKNFYLIMKILLKLKKAMVNNLQKSYILTKKFLKIFYMIQIR